MQLTPSNVGIYRQLALSRLLLAFTGWQHAKLTKLSNDIGTLLRRRYMTQADAVVVSGAMRELWDAYIKGWQDKLHEARREGVLIAFGEQAIAHSYYLSKNLTESKPEIAPVFEQQIDEILTAAERRIYDDGFNLSKRIWRQDAMGWQGLKGTLYNGIASQQSAWEIARAVESYLAPLQNCPRWTRARLYGLTKGDISGGNRTGLLSGDECSPEAGVAYNALRLARTEITYASAAATRQIHKRSPWIEKVQFNLNPQHPEPDICDDAANGGEGGNGIYEAGSEPIVPLHPHCLCFTTGVQMSDEAFRSKMRGWIQGTEQWRDMDVYANNLGLSRFNITDNLTIIAGLGKTLYRWLVDIPAASQPYLPSLE